VSYIRQKLFVIVATTCPVPHIFDKYVVISHKSDLEVGGSIYIRCTEGFKPVGENRLICLENGKWNKLVPTCQGTIPSLFYKILDVIVIR